MNITTRGLDHTKTLRQIIALKVFSRVYFTQTFIPPTLVSHKHEDLKINTSRLKIHISIVSYIKCSLLPLYKIGEGGQQQKILTKYTTTCNHYSKSTNKALLYRDCTHN